MIASAQKYGDLLTNSGLENVFAGGGVSVWRWPTDVATPGRREPGMMMSDG